MRDAGIGLTLAVRRLRWFLVFRRFDHSCFYSELSLIRLDYCLFSLGFGVRGVEKSRFFRGALGLKRVSERQNRPNKPNVQVK
jgi:hypothetical protein